MTSTKFAAYQRTVRITDVLIAWHAARLRVIVQSHREALKLPDSNTLELQARAQKQMRLVTRAFDVARERVWLAYGEVA